MPYERGDVLAAIHREGEVLVERHHADVAELRVRVDEAGAARFRQWVAVPDADEDEDEVE